MSSLPKRKLIRVGKNDGPLLKRGRIIELSLTKKQKIAMLFEYLLLSVIS